MHVPVDQQGEAGRQLRAYYERHLSELDPAAPFQIRAQVRQRGALGVFEPVTLRADFIGDPTNAMVVMALVCAATRCTT